MGILDIGITGMSCEHCAENVRSSISRIDGVTKVSVNLKRERAEIEGEASLEDIQSAVEAVGYKVKA